MDTSWQKRIDDVFVRLLPYPVNVASDFFVAILHDPAEIKGASGCVKRITIAGQGIEFITGDSTDQLSYRLNAASNNAWYYNENINISFVKVFDNNQIISIVAEYF